MKTEKLELKPTGKTEKILGYPCEQFEIKSRSETMEIWATDKLIPFQPYLRSAPARAGRRMIEEQWSALLKEKKLFPLRASLRFGGAAMTSGPLEEKPEERAAATGAERFRFEVKLIKPEKLGDKQETLFQPPPGYAEIQDSAL